MTLTALLTGGDTLPSSVTLTCHTDRRRHNANSRDPDSPTDRKYNAKSRDSDLTDKRRKITCPLNPDSNIPDRRRYVPFYIYEDTGIHYLDRTQSYGIHDLGDMWQINRRNR
jgi:hypothetical protein